MDPDAVLLAARLTPPVKELIDQVETKWSGFLSAVCLDWITAIKQEEIQLAVLTEVLVWSPVSPPQNLSAAVMYKIKSRGLSIYGATAARTAAEAAASV